MTSYSNYVKDQIQTKELYPDIRLFAQKLKIPIIELDTALFLQLMVKIHRPQKVLEIGAAIGYSTLYLLEDFTGEKLITIELSKDNIVHLRNNLPPGKNIEIIEGDALNVLPYINMNDLDLVFIDARKADYQSYFELIDDKLNKDGLVIFDNIFWHGAVTGNPIKDRYLRSKDVIKSFTANFLQKEKYFSTIVNVGDGLLLGVKNG